MAEELVQRVLAESSPDDPVFTGGELDEVLGFAITGTVHRTVAAQFTSSRVLFFSLPKQNTKQITYFTGFRELQWRLLARPTSGYSCSRSHRHRFRVVPGAARP